MDLNLGIVANYVLWDVLAQLYCPTGHAITPIPVTEAIRVPSANEILQVHILGRKMETAARELFPRLDFSREVNRKDRLVKKGRKVFQKTLERLDSLGVDIKDPVRLLYVLKKLGPSQFETYFGVGETDDSYFHHRKPVMIVDYYSAIQEKTLAIERMIKKEHPRFSGLRDRKVVITSCGGEVLAISTHNGMAHDFARLLREELVKQAIDVPVFMGGRLNQNVEGETLPRDVATQLKDDGITPCDSIEQFLEELIRLFS